VKTTWTLTVCAALATLGATGACGTTNNTGPSNSSDVGQSCAQTADCKAGLICVGGSCTENGTTADGGTSSSGASSSGGNTDASASGSSSGGSSSSSGGSVPEAAPPRLGALGDVCQSSAQCSTGLECLPLQVGSAGTTLAIGTCQQSSYASLDGSVTGKTCAGECNTAADCCALPTNVSINGTTYHSCLDIKTQVIGDVASCSTLANGDSTALGVGCFYYQTYCAGCSTGSGSAWSCTGNQCVYTASCHDSNVVVGGCPSMTRTGRTLTTNCNAANACSDATGPVCTTNLDCAGKSYVPVSSYNGYGDNAICTADAGTSTDCVCKSGSCYLACNRDLDCAIGYTCDWNASTNTGTHLCKSVGSCTTDAQCVQLQYNAAAKCVSNACVVPCTTDQECNPAGVTGFAGQACVNGSCQNVGCSSDTDCNILSRNTNGVHMFCVSTPATMTNLESAISQ
jgi:hypothetical protein